MTLYSIVIPLKNEADNIATLIREIEGVILPLNIAWELICVDDGSTDKTSEIIRNLMLSHPYLRLIGFNRNYGQSSAFSAGFKAAIGEFIITLDGDGQNDPADIPRLIERISGCDLVCGVRRKRQDSWSKCLISKAANFVRNWVCKDDTKDTGCSLKIYRKASLDQIKLYDGMHRFLPLLFKIEGFLVEQIEVNHRRRWQGKSHYHFFNRSFNTIADMLAVRWMRKRHLHYQIAQEWRNDS